PERGQPTTKVRRISPPDIAISMNGRWQRLVDRSITLFLHLTLPTGVVTAPIAPLLPPGGGHGEDCRPLGKQVAGLAAGQYQVEAGDEAVTPVLEGNGADQHAGLVLAQRTHRKQLAQ